MKKKAGLFGFFILSIIALTACHNDLDRSNELQEMADYDNYYLYKGNKIPLQRMEGKFYVAFYPADETRFKEELAKAGGVLENEVAWKDNSFYSSSTDMTGFGAQKFTNFITAIVNGSYEQCATALSVALYWGPFYRTENEDEIGVTEMFTVILKPGTNLAQLEKLSKKNAVEMTGRDTIDSNWYHLACTHLSKGNALEMANLFYTSGLFEDAFPSMIMNIVFD